MELLPLLFPEYQEHVNTLDESILFCCYCALSEQTLANKEGCALTNRGAALYTIMSQALFPPSEN